MNPILKALLIRRSKEQGFAIPFVIALGLIMVLLGTISIIKSQDENLTAITQRKTSQALSAAEAGVARYIEFLQKNSAIASFGYSNTSWTTLSTCDDLDATSVNNLGTWQTIPGYSSYGYKLVSYQYSATNATLPDNNTFGTLKVDARTPLGKGLGNSYAISRVSVQVPVRPEIIGSSYSTSPSSTASYSLNPVLWIGSDASNNFGSNLKVSYASVNGQSLGGNVIFSRPKSGANPCSSTGFPTTLLQDSTRQFMIADPRTIPNTPDLPTTPTVPNNSYVTITPTELKTTILPSGFSSGNRLLSYAKTADNYYRYLVDGDVTLDSTEKIEIRSGSKVILYLRGNLTLNRGARIVNPNSSAYLEIYGNCYLVSNTNRQCTTTPTTTRKYGGTTVTDTITFSSLGDTGGGNIDLTAFIHAPIATVVSNNTPTVRVTGAMWVNLWSAAVGNNSFITPDITAVSGSSYQSSVFYTTTSSSFMGSKPLIYSPTQWTTEETN